MSPNFIRMATHLRGNNMTARIALGRGEKRAANLSTSTQTWRCCNRPGARDHVFFPLCVGRRKRRELLDPRPLWKPRGHAAAAGLVAGEYLLPHLRLRGRRRRACARIHAQQGSGQRYGQRKSEFEYQRHRQSWLCDPVLCIRDAGARRPGVGVPHGGLWRRRHQPGGDLVRRGHGPVRQHRPLRAVRQPSATRHGALGIWRRCSN